MVDEDQQWGPNLPTPTGPEPWLPWPGGFLRAGVVPMLKAPWEGLRRPQSSHSPFWGELVAWRRLLSEVRRPGPSSGPASPTFTWPLLPSPCAARPTGLGEHEDNSRWVNEQEAKPDLPLVHSASAGPPWVLEHMEMVADEWVHVWLPPPSYSCPAEKPRLDRSWSFWWEHS